MPDNDTSLISFHLIDPLKAGCVVASGKVSEGPGAIGDDIVISYCMACFYSRAHFASLNEPSRSKATKHGTCYPKLPIGHVGGDEGGTAIVGLKVDGNVVGSSFPPSAGQDMYSTWNGLAPSTGVDVVSQH